MAYTDRNFKTKKLLKEAVADWNEYQAQLAEVEKLKSSGPMTVGAVLGCKVERSVLKANPVTCYQPGPFNVLMPANGRVYLEGPHYPAPHTWYAQAELKDGVVVKVK